ncbi:hypothetical protein [Sagittula salina]|uniref:Uncharacterized protein n=1 Tax=Sagittula salina TaxID=2820268 RepID=A0A940MG41_9RHOB|nr:hypothetical protein [Sagittula salina]MBP0481045.1 hypothetical protein [Sagittula salina]
MEEASEVRLRMKSVADSVVAPRAMILGTHSYDPVSSSIDRYGWLRERRALDWENTSGHRA